MSAQGGILHFDEHPVDRQRLGSLMTALQECGPDGERTYVAGPLGMVYCAFHTTPESRREQQPIVSPRGCVVTWDGRLDNREDLLADLELDRSSLSDAAIAAAAYERWGTGCFRKLEGDWALAIWDPARKTLIMGRDIFAIRHLYYHLTTQHLMWSTDLRPLVLQADATWKLDENYIAGFLVSFPEADRTPFVGLRAVPPASFVEVCDGRATVRAYWHLDPRDTIRYRTDGEYEDHFRHLFRQSVRRRLRSDAPVLSDLSGGMDSSAIVCMADEILARGETACPRLDTITLYDDLEPTGDERTYACYVEAKRGRTGHHIHTAGVADLSPVEPGVFVPRPGFFQSNLNIGRRYAELMRRQGNRVVLRGSGGDEFLGGVPDPLPQLADLLVTGHWSEFAHQAVEWSVVKKRPFTNLLARSLWQVAPQSLRSALKLSPALCDWVQPAMLNRCRLTAYYLGRPRGGPRLWLPTQRVNRHTQKQVSRQFAQMLDLGGTKESRYPFLDRSLVAFLTAVPDEQLLRPGQRRSLMRRALAEIVPAPVLNRKSKARVFRGYAVQLPRWIEVLSGTCWNESYLNVERLRQAVAESAHGHSKGLIPVLKALDLLVFCARWDDRRDAAATIFDWTASVQPFQKERR